MKIFSNEEIRAIDRYTIEHEGVTTMDLIERVAQGVACEIMSRFRPERRMVIFAGWGKNGADAVATALMLMEQGYRPEIYLFNIGGDRLCTECRACRDMLLEDFPDARLIEVINDFDMPELDDRCVIVDGLFGTGLNRPIPGSFQMIIRSINESGADIVAIDVPSGLHSDWNTQSVNRNIIHATLTVAVEFPRLSFFIDDNAELVGRWITIDVGLSRDAIRRAPYSYYYITAADARRILHARKPNCSKADFGHAFIAAGSYGMMGAAVMVAKGCLRAGVGKLTCYAPKCGYHIIQSAVPEAMFMRDSHDTSISEITLTRDYRAVAIGPGIGTADITINALENFLKLANANGRPVVLDADALNCISIRPIMLNYLPVLSVLTPHAGEFDRLFGKQPSAEARLRKAMEVSAFHNVVIVLKGRYTAVVRPDGKVHINSSGTPAMATPGSGDVLTGIITALIAQGYTPETAATVGVYIHGLAGEIAERTHGSYGVMAMDIADAVGQAIKEIMQPENNL